MKTKLLLSLVLLNTLFIAVLWIKHQSFVNATIHRPNDVIVARAIVLVDSMGVERAILGAHLPDPTFHGYRVSRGGAVSGLMLFDAEGQERGGYVTDDEYGNIFLTLDSKTSQQALFIAEPQGGATMQVWGRNANKISIGAYEDTIAVDMNLNGKNINFKRNE